MSCVRSTRTDAVKFTSSRNENAGAAKHAGSFHSIVELIGAATERHPHATAVETEAERLCYADLSDASWRIAEGLLQQGVGPESRVAICAEPGLEFVMGVLGILKAGGAYVFLDPTLPAARLRWLFEDCGASLIVATEGVRPIARQLSDGGGRLIGLGELPLAPDGTAVRQARRSIAPTDLAYIIYTSGSAGQPKGVLLEHAGLAAMARAHMTEFELGPGRRVLQFSSLAFDASVHEIFATLASGATLCLARRDSLLPGRPLFETLKQREISCVLLPPFVWETLPDAALPHLKTAIAGGDRCTSHSVQAWGRGRQFFNAYGPTESTVTATLWRCDPGESADPPIGTARDGIELFVLDADGQDAAPGQRGELFIGGLGVARGYVNQPQQTAERFVEVKRPSGAAVRAFRTGDAVVVGADGALRFMGRLDRQLKIRGHRIEPAEIETQLHSCPAIHEAAVVAYRAERLAAFCALSPGATWSAAAVRDWLEERLPRFMVPNRIEFVAHMPRTPNGKVDYEALRHQLEQADRGAEDVACAINDREEPRSQEAALLDLWKTVLGAREVARTDHFVELGGDSLCAAQIAGRAESLGISFTAGELLAHPTVASLLAYIHENREAGTPSGT